MRSQIPVEPISERRPSPDLAVLPSLRAYRVTELGFLGREFPAGAVLFVTWKAPPRAGDLIVRCTEAGRVLAMVDASELRLWNADTTAGALEVVICWRHRFNCESGSVPGTPRYPGRTGTGVDATRRVVHVDLDAFFVEVERRANPSLIGQPVIVGGSPGRRGVVVSASYEARRFGIHSAMPVARALRLCPELIIVAPHHSRYAAASSEVMRVLRRYSPAIEAASIDEAYLDLAGTSRSLGAAADTCRRLQAEIRERLRLDTSHGLAGNKLVAKIASDLAKPNGMMEILPGREAEFLAPLRVGCLPGIGRVTNALLKEYDVLTIGDVVQLRDDQLEALFGRYGPQVRAWARGEDESSVETRDKVKSIGHEETFAADSRAETFLSSRLYQLVEHTARHLRERALRARTVQVKLRYTDFRTVVRAATLAEPTDQDGEIFDVAEALLVRLLRSDSGVRLVGVRLTNLVADHGQIGLFEEQSGRLKRRALNQVLDRIRSRYGHEAIRTGRTVRAGSIERTREAASGGRYEPSNA